MTNPPEITITKRDAKGRFVLSYGGRLVHRDDNLALARCPWPYQKAVDVAGVVISPGDVLVEYYYPREWFNVMRIEAGDGTLKGWYCNVTRPAEISEAKIAWSDLALDLLVLPDGRTQVLDEDEFADLHLSPEDTQAALAALDRLQQWVAEGRGPFEFGLGRCPRQL